MARNSMAKLATPAKERIQVSEVIPPTEKVTRTSVQLPDSMWERLTSIAKTMSEEAKREGRKPYTRDDVIYHFCRWGMQEWESERATKRGRR